MWLGPEAKNFWWQVGQGWTRQCRGSGQEVYLPPLRVPSPALSCNENDAEHLDRDQPYPSSQKTKRMRTSFKHHQLRTMKSYFAINHNPDAKDLKQLAQKTGLTKRVLQVSWAGAGAEGGGTGGLQGLERNPTTAVGLGRTFHPLSALLFVILCSFSIFSVSSCVSGLWVPPHFTASLSMFVSQLFYFVCVPLPSLSSLLASFL